MMASVRGRLYAGLAAIILLAGLAAGVTAFHWAYDEAIELQDEVLLQIGALAVSNPVKSGPVMERGIDTDAHLPPRSS